MARLLYTVQNLVDEVRAQIDEQNIDSVSTENDILPTLNRAQDYAFDVLARRYPEPILDKASLDLISNQAEYDIPENVFEDRVLKMEIEIPSGAGRSTYREVQQISYRDISEYESSSLAALPYYYCIIGRKMRFVPAPTGTYNARMWFLRSPEKLMLPQGRITVVNAASNYVIVDSAGSSLTTEADQLGSYVNIVDGQSGLIKGSLQIQNINDSGKIIFRTVPTRTSVLNREILEMADITDIALDDYIAPIDGTCVPYYGRPVSNFLIQYTVAELVRKLGGSSDTEEKVLEKFEKQLERTYARREPIMRIRKTSPIWGTTMRRLFWE